MPPSGTDSAPAAVNTPASEEGDAATKLPGMEEVEGVEEFSLLLSRPQAAYMCLVLLVQAYCMFLHEFGPLRRLQFLPLLLTSLTCAGGVLWAWLQVLILCFHY